MKVVWYYISDGKKVGPVDWSSLREAAKSGLLKETDLVWTHGYGSEWKKAEVLDTLFDHGEAAPSVQQPSTNADAVPDSELDATIIDDDDFISDHNIPSALKNSPFGQIYTRLYMFPSPFSIADDELEDGKPKQVKVVEALRNAWMNMCTILFRPFSFLRLLFFALAALLCILGAGHNTTLLGSNFFDFGEVFSMSADGRDARGSGNATFLVFFDDYRNDIQSGEFAKKISEDKEYYNKILINKICDITKSNYNVLCDIIKKKRFFVIRCILSICLFLSLQVLASSWLNSRGRTLILARIYHRDMPFFITWFSTHRASRLLFKGLLVLNMFLIVSLLALSFFIFYRFATVGQNLPYENNIAFLNMSSKAIMAVLFVYYVLTVIIQDFVVPRLLLENHSSFMSAFFATVKTLGFWFVRYLLLASIVYLALTILSVVLISKFFLLSAFILAPVFLLRALWGIDIVINQRPILRKATPIRKCKVDK